MKQELLLRWIGLTVMISIAFFCNSRTIYGYSGKISPELMMLIEQEEPVTVMVYLNNQPFHIIALQTQQDYQPRFEESLQQLPVIDDFVWPQNQALSYTEEISILRAMQPLTLVNTRATTVLTELKTLRQLQMREIAQTVQARTISEQAALADFVQQLGGSVLYHYTLVNALAVRIPAHRISELSLRPDVRYVDIDKVAQMHLNDSVATIAAPTWWNNGFTGSSVWWIGVVDTGIDGSHPGLQSHNFYYSRVFHTEAQGNTDYNDDPASADDLVGHGTHIAGIVGSTDETYRGVAYETNLIINAKAGYLGTDNEGHYHSVDVLGAVDWAVITVTADILNYSAGHTTTVDYDAFSQFWDGVVDDTNTVVVKSAGNEGPDVSTVTSPGNAYNVITVAALDDRGTVERDDDSVADFSSRGPTIGGRKKPDLIAPGVAIRSCNNEWEGVLRNDFVNKEGTSMAAPHVAGAVNLLMNANIGINNPRVIKALLINSAEDRGESSWDAEYGWGYIDLEHAYLHRDHTFSDVIYPQGYHFYSGPMQSGDKATLVWHRHVAYDGPDWPDVVYNLNDLDLFLYDELTGLGADASMSSIDNVEQVKSGDYASAVVKVRAFSEVFSGVTEENYALATEEGFARVAPPHLNIEPVINTATFSISSTYHLRFRINNMGELRAHNVDVWLDELPAGLTLISGVYTQTIGILEPGQSLLLSWEIGADSIVSRHVFIRGVSSSYGERFTGFNYCTVRVFVPTDFVYLPVVLRALNAP